MGFDLFTPQVTKAMFHFIWTKVSKLAFNAVTAIPNISVLDRYVPTAHTPVPSILLNFA